MIESMVVGVKALMESAELVDLIEEEEKETKFDKWVKKWLGDKYFNYMIYFSVVVALAISIGLFMLLPNLIAGLFRFDKQTAGGALLANLIEGLIRITLFISYVYLVSKIRKLKECFNTMGPNIKLSMHTKMRKSLL